MDIKINFGGVYTTAEGNKYKLIGEATNYKQGAGKVYLFAQLNNNDTTGVVVVAENKLSDFTFQHNTY